MHLADLNSYLDADKWLCCLYVDPDAWARKSTPPQPKITGVLTILSPKPGATPEQVLSRGC
jgi:hypothetical protein